jgi:hypothetical protein
MLCRTFSCTARPSHLLLVAEEMGTEDFVYDLTRSHSLPLNVRVQLSSRLNKIDNELRREQDVLAVNSMSITEISCPASCSSSMTIPTSSQCYSVSNATSHLKGSTESESITLVKSS